MSGRIESKEAPSVRLPKSSETCTISIINTTTDLTIAVPHFVEPEIKGHEYLNLRTYAFYIKHGKSGKELLFDLGARKDWQNYVPSILNILSSSIPGMKIQKDVLDILPDGNVDVNNIHSFILSHWHFDHAGNIAALPKSVNLVVGPGFKDAFMPGYPTKEDSPFWDADFEGRKVVEIAFEDLKIGQFPAHDFFGDGSLYILDVPGHAIGHIAALVRTTPDTAVLLGGDVCHFTGAIRPTEYTPLPEHIPKETQLDSRIQLPCPCSAFTALHPDPQKSRTSPFYKIATGEGTFFTDPAISQQSVDRLVEFDADPNILVVIAHDPSYEHAFSFFPEHTMNDWKKKGWKERVHWGFVNELPYNGQPAKEPLVDGLYRDGKRIKDLKGNEV